VKAWTTSISSLYWKVSRIFSNLIEIKIFTKSSRHNKEKKMRVPVGWSRKIFILNFEGCLCFSFGGFWRARTFQRYFSGRRVLERCRCIYFNYCKHGFAICKHHELSQISHAGYLFSIVLPIPSKGMPRLMCFSKRKAWSVSISSADF